MPAPAGGTSCSARRPSAGSAASTRELSLAALEARGGLLTRYGGGTADAAVLDFDAHPADRPGHAGSGPAVPDGWGRLSAGTVVDLLTEIGCSVEAWRRALTVTPPSWRPDLTDPADLVEEVVRLDGYEKVPSQLPIAPPGRGLTRAQRLRRSVGRALAEAGYVEVLSYPFVGQSSLDALGLPAADRRRQVVRLLNPLVGE